jgi:DNA-binding transcriptional MerR regulator
MTRTPRRQATPRRRPARASKPLAGAAAIPERGLKIGEAAHALGVETYVLRFWETQFPFVKPKHSRTRHRFYHQRDLDVLRLIRRLLHAEGFTIAGANKYIKEHGLDALLAGKKPAVAAPAHRAEGPARDAHDAEGKGPAREVLAAVRRDLESLHKLLESG